MVDNDLGFQQVETKCPSQTKTFLFISNDKKVGGCLIAEHIQEVRGCSQTSQILLCKSKPQNNRLHQLRYTEPCECSQGYRVIEEPVPEGSEGEKVMFERQRAWCCSTTPEPAICGISRIWVVSMMRRQGIASRMLECLRSVRLQTTKICCWITSNLTQLMLNFCLFSCTGTTSCTAHT